MRRSAAQGTSVFHPATPDEDRMKVKVSSASENRKQTHTGRRASKRTAALPDHSLPRPSPDQQEQLSPQEDSDTDLSESERLPLSCRPLAPRLELRPEVVEDGDAPTHCRTVRGRDFPDCLPPPFNSWSLSQLAVFYNTEGRGVFRPRPVGPLERYLERLLQLEWYQIQTVQVEHGTQDVPGGTSGCQRSSAAAPARAPTRLSSPKCILQCQRAFPLSFLSSLAGHSALLAGGTSGLCRICSSSCSTSCYRSTHSHNHLSRLSPDGSRGPLPRPKRSYSESRVHSSDRRLRTQRSGSPTSSSNYLRRMQASGNIRNPIQAGPGRSHSSARGRDEPDWTAEVLRKRSGSEQRRGGGRRVNRSETSRSSSEGRTGGEERDEAPGWAAQEVTGISVGLPRSRHPPVHRRSRSKQVEFVT
ncbi:uncharacterized protein LOC129354840 isoform X2 [Poeciliopsis prolifica]|uniref:uncharacterized protein LOC129354840 isoform X2 n=1 Tax=Poeciliopsis prolifica TaxID=188132 RepID=UPI002413227A|nr:uncharacterized protein LOC129354840 isoform X2 [Poeciliopsis prolifica]